MDKEIIIMFSAGVARTRMMRPVLLLSFLVAGVVVALSFYAGPWTQKMLKARSLEINTDITNAMLQPGVFTNPAAGITAFIRSRDEKGYIYGIFFQDGRNPDKPVSYTAESGALVYRQGQTNLLMFNGHVQHYDKQAPNAGITFVNFDRYSYDLSQLTQITTSKNVRGRELYPSQLYARWFDKKTPQKQKKDIYLFANNAMLKAFYVIAYGFIVLAVFLPAQISRQGYTKRITVAALVALGLSFSHFPILTYGYDNIFFFAWLYLNPMIVIALALFVCLRGVGVFTRIKHHRATKKADRTPPATLSSLEVI
jgi:lipopolysaccharide export system permease protein